MNRLEAHKLKKTARPLVALAFAGYLQDLCGFVAKVAACRMETKHRCHAFKRFKAGTVATVPLRRSFQAFAREIQAPGTKAGEPSAKMGNEHSDLK
jgi:hypothetical protein